MLKVGGILVMPLNDQLLQIKRTSETTWDVHSLLLVSFASLIQPRDENKELVRMSKSYLLFGHSIYIYNFSLFIYS